MSTSSETGLRAYHNSFKSPPASRADWVDAAAAGAILGVAADLVACLDWRGLNARPSRDGGSFEEWTVRFVAEVLAREAAVPLDDRDWVSPAQVFGATTLSQAARDARLDDWIRLGCRIQDNGESGAWRRVEQVCAFDLSRLVGTDPPNGRGAHYAALSRRIVAEVHKAMFPPPAPADA